MKSRSSYNADIEWFIRCGSVAQGERGTASALLEMLKHGRPTGASGVPNTDLYSNRQIGWAEPSRDGGAPRPMAEGEIARARRCLEVWRKLSPASREVLLGRYDSRQWAPGMAGALGDLTGVVVVLVGSKRAADRIRRSHEAIAGHASKLEEALSRAHPDVTIVRRSWVDNPDGGSRTDEVMTMLRTAIESKSPNDVKALRSAHDALQKQAELESSAQPGILNSDWQCVVDSCQSTKRERAKQRGQWLRDAAEALSEAHGDWDAVRVAIAEEWAK